MDHATTYSQLLFPPERRVAGIRLLPLSIGHALLLHRVGSPFARGLPAERFTGDLLLGLWVCSRPWRLAARDVGTWKCRWLLKLWAWQIRLVEYHETRRDGFAQGLDAAWADWSNYLRASWARPQTWERGRSEGRTMGAPVALTLKVILQSRLGLSEAAALDMSVARAQWDCAVYAELEDAVEIVSTETSEAIDDALKNEDKLLEVFKI